MVAYKNLILMCVAFAGISARPNGAPEEACESMTPKHNGSVGYDLAYTPYKIQVREDQRSKMFLILSFSAMLCIETERGH